MSEIFLGVDLGKTVDHTAVAIIEKRIESELNKRGDNTIDTTYFDVVNLKRYPIGTEYTDVLDDLNNLLARPEVNGATVVVDHTGAGVPILDFYRKLLRGAGSIIGVTITSGSTVTEDYPNYRVPQRDLISKTVILGQMGRLRIAEELGNITDLIREFMSIDVKISDSGHDSYGARRYGQHDDMAYAIFIGVWYGDRPKFEYHYYGGSGEDERKRREGSIFELERRLNKNKKPDGK